MTTEDGLQSSLLSHNKAFENLVDLIPPQYYILKEDNHIPSKFDKNDPTKNMPTSQLQLQTVNSNGTSDNIPAASLSSIQSLRAKLHERIEALKQGPKESRIEAGNRDELLEERRAQRAEMRERRRRETKERIREQKDKCKYSLLANGPIAVDKSAESHSTVNVTFSSLSSDRPSKAGKQKASSDPEQALAQIRRQKEKLMPMDEDKRASFEERQKWQKAGLRMDGVKIKDNETRLKRTVKRHSKQRANSAKEWKVVFLEPCAIDILTFAPFYREERKKKLSDSMMARAKKRNDNIAQRIERRNTNKKGIKPKKSRPGFEGRGFVKGKHGRRS